MSDVAYTASIRIERVEGVHRRAWVPAHEGLVEIGVHGPIAAHYGAEPESEIATTPDLRDGRRGRMTDRHLRERAGVEKEDGVLVIRPVHVIYHLVIPPPAL